MAAPSSTTTPNIVLLTGTVGESANIVTYVTDANVYASQKEYGQAIAIYTDLASSSPTDVNVLGRLAQLQFAAGMKSASVKTLQAIEKSHPELKDQIDAAIKQVQGN